jgi:hypothetical protein
MKWFFAFVALVVIGVLVFLTRRQPILEKVAKLSLPQPTPSESESIVTKARSDHFETDLSEQNIEISQIASSSALVDCYASDNLNVPEDSVLRRHYLSNQEAERLAITHPYPTDSMLFRHYQSHLWSILAQSVDVVVQQTILQPSVAEKTNPVVDVIIADTGKTKIPEDATLRRHFLTQVQNDVLALLVPRPTDSTLKRHYDSLFNTKLNEYLTQYIE